VLYFDGWVYVAAIPDLWRLTDTDGDGVADVEGNRGRRFRRSHRLCRTRHAWPAPWSGRSHLYWTVGDRGANVLSKEGRRFAYPDEGCVLRCEPDGNRFEVFAHGIRNTEEIAFDDFGDVIGV
jgi:hypothetical protein